MDLAEGDESGKDDNNPSRQIENLHFAGGY